MKNTTTPRGEYIANSATSATNNPAPVEGCPVMNRNSNPAPVEKAPAPLFKHLRAAVIKEGDERKTAEQFYIKNGYFKKWDNETKNDVITHKGIDGGIYLHLTPAKFNDYKSGKINRAAAVKLATARAFKDIDKQTAKKLDLIATAENAPALNCINIGVEWARNRIWGYNPTATATAYSQKTDGEHVRDEATGRASGCGYDKQSAAISESLNKIPAILKILYTAEENRIKGRESRKQPRRDVIGYGSGYGVLPYFEGGCGVSVYHKIFDACGFVFKCTGNGKMFDAYAITKKGGRK